MGAIFRNGFRVFGFVIIRITNKNRPFISRIGENIVTFTKSRTSKHANKNCSDPILSTLQQKHKHFVSCNVIVYQMEEQKNAEVIPGKPPQHQCPHAPPAAQSNYLVECMTQLASYEGKVLSVEELYDTKCILYTLHRMSPETFPMQLSNSELQSIFSQYFYRQFGYYIRPFLREQTHKQRMITLSIYACLYSARREMFVERIMKLHPIVQEEIVNDMERLEGELRGMRNQDRLIQSIARLQIQNDDLKTEVSVLKEQKWQYESQLSVLNEQLEETRVQRNTFIVEKRKILSRYTLSNLAEYEDLCIKLTRENEGLLRREEELTEAILELEKENKNLKEELKHSDQLIFSLNLTKDDLTRRCEELTQEITAFHQSTFNINNSSSKRLSKDRRLLENSSGEEEAFRRQQPVVVPVARKETPQDLLVNTKSSGFSVGRQPVTSVRNLFAETKNSLLLHEKVGMYEEELEILKLKILELEGEIDKLNDRERYLLKKNRKIKRVSDQFQSEYDGITEKML